MNKLRAIMLGVSLVGTTLATLGDPCPFCGEEGHPEKSCKWEKVFAELEGRGGEICCPFCGKEGHSGVECEQRVKGEYYCPLCDRKGHSGTECTWREVFDMLNGKELADYDAGLNWGIDYLIKRGVFSPNDEKLTIDSLDATFPVLELNRIPDNWAEEAVFIWVMGRPNFGDHPLHSGFALKIGYWDDAFCRYLIPVLQNDKCPIVALTIIGAIGAPRPKIDKTFFKALENNKSVAKLVLYNVHMGEGRFDALASVLDHNSCLHELELMSCYDPQLLIFLGFRMPEPLDVKYFLEALKSSSALYRLRIRHVDGLELLPLSLGPNLESLEFNSELFDPLKGVTIDKEMLHLPPHLEIDYIDNSCVDAICHLIEESETLEKLVLGYAKRATCADMERFGRAIIVNFLNRGNFYALWLLNFYPRNKDDVFPLYIAICINTQMVSVQLEGEIPGGEPFFAEYEQRSAVLQKALEKKWLLPNELGLLVERNPEWLGIAAKYFKRMELPGGELTTGELNKLLEELPQLASMGNSEVHSIASDLLDSIGEHIAHNEPLYLTREQMEMVESRGKWAKEGK